MKHNSKFKLRSSIKYMYVSKRKNTHPLVKDGQVAFKVDGITHLYFTFDRHLEYNAIRTRFIDAKGRYRYQQECDSSMNNDHIFGLLGIHFKDAYCSYFYGYTAYGGIWPQYRPDDFRAAERVIDHLQSLCRMKPAQRAKTLAELLTRLDAQAKLDDF